MGAGSLTELVSVALMYAEQVSIGFVQANDMRSHSHSPWPTVEMGKS